MAGMRAAALAAGVACWLAAPSSAEVRADLEVVKMFSKTGEGSLTLLYSDFSANIMAAGAHNNVCAWDVCRGNRQGLKFSNGEDLWTAGEGTRVGSFQVMTPVHNIKFTKFCARSFDYDPDDESWWVSKGFGTGDGRVKDTDIGYIQIEGLHDFCAVSEEKYKEGATTARTPSPIKTRKLLEDDIFDELRRVQANMKTMPVDRVMVELATIKKRASRASGLEAQILPIMRDIHAQLTAQGGGGGEPGGGGADGSRRGKLKVSAQRKSRRVMAVVLGGGAVLVGLIVMLFGGSSKDEAGDKGAKGKKETKKTK